MVSAFENLFLNLRKINFNKLLYPDTNHLHQLIFHFQKKKFSVLKSNNFTGIFINLYNITAISLSMIDPHTQLQIILIILNLSYIVFYMEIVQI